MFTGIVEGVGRVVRADRREGGLRLAIATSLPLDEIHRGDSVAVDGVCLTVVALERELFQVDVIPETLRCTTLGRVGPDSRVNLERALRLSDRLDGHLVQGHVDAAAPVRAIRESGGDYRVEVALVPEIRPYVAMKGSIALSGVSLTVAGLGPESFEVALIPETLEKTTLGQLTVEDRVNVEADLLARYLERLLQAGRAS
jgi:riboflavin synthase